MDPATIEIEKTYISVRDLAADEWLREVEASERRFSAVADGHRVERALSVDEPPNLT